jgi:hypothetical protein
MEERTIGRIDLGGVMDFVPVDKRDTFFYISRTAEIRSDFNNRGSFGWYCSKRGIKPCAGYAKDYYIRVLVPWMREDTTKGRYYTRTYNK